MLANSRPATNVTVELICDGSITHSFPMSRAALPRLSVIIDPPPRPRCRADIAYATGRLVDGPTVRIVARVLAGFHV